MIRFDRLPKKQIPSPQLTPDTDPKKEGVTEEEVRRKAQELFEKHIDDQNHIFFLIEQAEQFVTWGLPERWEDEYPGYTAENLSLLAAELKSMIESKSQKKLQERGAQETTGAIDKEEVRRKAQEIIDENMHDREFPPHVFHKIKEYIFHRSAKERQDEFPGYEPMDTLLLFRELIEGIKRQLGDNLPDPESAPGVSEEEVAKKAKEILNGWMDEGIEGMPLENIVWEYTNMKKPEIDPRHVSKPPREVGYDELPLLFPNYTLENIQSLGREITLEAQRRDQKVGWNEWSSLIASKRENSEY